MQKTVLLSIMLIVLSIAGFASADQTRLIFSKRTVYDTQTGLTWAKQADFDKNNLEFATAYIRGLAKAGMGGANDWRMPTKDELETLASYAKEAGFDGKAPDNKRFQFFTALGFENMQNDWYWTSTPHPNYPNNNYYVHMGNNIIDGGYVELKGYILPVRGSILSTYKFPNYKWDFIP